MVCLRVTTFSNKLASRDGGGVSAPSSDVGFNGSTTLSNNLARNDDGIYICTFQPCEFHERTSCSNNSASGDDGDNSNSRVLTTQLVVMVVESVYIRPVV